MPSSASGNGGNAHGAAFRRVPLNRYFPTHQLSQTLPPPPPPPPSKSLDLGHKASTIARPKTSHARLQPAEHSEAPRIPHAFNRTPPVTSHEHHSTTNWHPEHYPTAEPSRNLSSYSSFSSLRSHNSDTSSPKKRKRLLPFRKRFIGAWKESISKETHIEDPEQMDISEMTAQLADLPADLKPAAARRLGIEYQDTKVPSPMPHAFVVRTGPSSVIHSRVSSRSEVPSATSSRQSYKRRSRRTSNSSTISPINGQIRPEHPLEAEARSLRLQNVDSVHEHEEETEQITFYASSSDSEDDDRYSSGYSCGSSHTSYNMTSPLPSVQDVNNSFTSSQNTAPRLASFTERSPLPQSQGSTSSSSSHQANESAWSASRPPSFSRPLPRLPFQQGVARSPQTSMISRDGEGEALAQLAAISEDKPFQPSDMLEDKATPPRNQPKPFLSSLRKVGSSATKSISKVVSRGDLKTVTDESRLGAERAPIQSTLPNVNINSLHLNIPAADKKSARPLSLAVTKQSEALISADSAETVILHIFETIDNFKDLYACARLNKGFYKVFKRHELRLMKNTLRNLSPAQWEHREASPTEIIAAREGQKREYTPTSYVQFQKRDDFVLTALKSMILARCQAFLRLETINALAERDPARSTRVDDAFWRIWTFCTIFGSDKGREHDISGQVDWLNGGVVAHRPTSPLSGATVRRGKSTSFISTTHAIESFGRGNYGGLTVDELDDMSEIWNCIKALLRGIYLGAGRCAQARAHGVFKEQDINKGNLNAEAALLEEWVYYLATLGPDTIVDLATESRSSTDEVFATAQSMEWTNWSLSQNGLSRSSFLEEAVAQLHAEKLNKSKQVSFEQMQAKRRSRGHELAAELREEKRLSVYTGDLLGQHDDQSIGVWLEWMAKVEGSKMSPPNEPVKNERKNPLAVVKEEKKHEDDASKRPTRQRRSNSSLSLFPTTYTKATPSGTPKMSPISTPRRSRNNSRSNSIVQHEETVEKFRQMATQERRDRDRDRERDQKQQLYTPRLSICQEA